MRRNVLLCVASVVWGATVAATPAGKVSILVDLDPATAERSVIVESITADASGRLYLPDQVTGNILRVDPKNPKPVVVGRIESRQVDGKGVRADGQGIDFNREGDLFITSRPFKEIVRIRGVDLNPDKPGLAQTFATGTEGANGIAFDRRGNLFISGSGNGKIYRVGPAGGSAEVVAQIEPYTRTLPDGKTRQSIVANGLAFDAQGVLYVADTARGAIWKVPIQADGKAGAPVRFMQNSLLEGADGLAFDGRGTLWVTANERNALVTVTPAGRIQEVAKNGSQGPLEFPSALVFVGNTAYISNYDTPRRDNMATDGKSSIDGIGASIAQITP